MTHPTPPIGRKREEPPHGRCLLPRTCGGWWWFERMPEGQWQLYNAALDERIDCRRKTGSSLKSFGQRKLPTLPPLGKSREVGDCALAKWRRERSCWRFRGKVGPERSGG